MIYHVYPEAARTRHAQWHFWLHNLGLPVFMVGQFLMLSGRDPAQPVVAIGATITLVGILSFGINVLRTVGEPSRAPTSKTLPLRYGQRMDALLDE